MSTKISCFLDFERLIGRVCRRVLDVNFVLSPFLMILTC